MRHPEASVGLTPTRGVPGSAQRPRTALTALLLGAASLFVVACGGGGGGGGDSGGGGNPPPAPTGSVAVTVVDEFQAPVLNGNVSVTVGSTTRSGSTSNGGVATISNVPVGSASVAVTAEGFLDGSGSAQVAENQQATTTIELVRVTAPAAALLTSSSSTTDGQTVGFTIDVLVVDKNGEPIENMTAGEFTLQPCTDDTAEDDCLQGAPSDTSYTVISGPTEFAAVPPNPAEPYAAMLLIDQSQSIRTTDPADARLFASKVFMDNLGPSDYVAVSAFAQTEPGTANAIPDQPVTLVTGFTQQTAQFFDDIDVLARQENGETPLFDSLDQMLQYTADTAPGSSFRSTSPSGGC
jgi:hypothetical protein